MFLTLTKTEIKNMIKKKLIQQISRWETLEKAMNFYSNEGNIYTAYIENHSNLNSAYSTPVIVYRLKELPTE